MLPVYNIPQRSSSLTLYALGAIFIIPLITGVFLVRSNADQTDQAKQVSHDLASMYSQGMDFSKPANRKIALRVAEGAGLRIGGGAGVVILSKIQLVNVADCGSADCPNAGQPVVIQRFVIGDEHLRNSSFGTPHLVDRTTGEVSDWATDTAARAEDITVNLKPGEQTYAAECYLSSSQTRSGVYSRALF